MTSAIDGGPAVLKPGPPGGSFPHIAKKVREKHGTNAELTQMLVLAEETGEAVKAFRQWKGLARRLTHKSYFTDELADVVITAYVAAELTDVDLDAAVAAKLAVIKDRGGL